MLHSILACGFLSLALSAFVPVRAAPSARACATVACVGGKAPVEDSLDLLPLAGLSAGDVLPKGWMVREVRGERPPGLQLVDADEGRALRVAGTNRAAWIVRPLDQPIAPGPGQLAWRWRVLEHPEGADLRDRGSDDAALRVFVVFERMGLFDRVPHTLFYTSGAVEGEHYERRSFQSSDLQVIRVGSPAPHAAWERTTASPFADYQRIWGGPPRRIVAIGLMQDSEDTMSHASAEIRALVWHPGGAEPVP